MISANPSAILQRQVRGLRHRFQRQIGQLPNEELRDRTDLIALTFRPGDRTATFRDKWLRPLGSAVHVVLSYADDASSITLGGYRGYGGPGGHVFYGCHEKREFQYDVRRLTRDRSPSDLPIERNPSLAELALRMDKACARRSSSPRPDLPRLPKILLGFAPHELPPYEATLGLRQLVAKQVAIPLKRLQSNPPEIVEPLLRNAWEEIVAGTPIDSDTGLILLDADICSSDARPLRVFEDFRPFIGDWTWNPIRELKLPQFPNPAHEILHRFGIDPRDGFDQPIPDVRFRAMIEAYRTAIGDSAGGMDEEDVLDGLVLPDEPLVPVSAAIEAMRRKLSPYWNECATDLDLRLAARRRLDPLFASGACHIQVLRQRVVREPLKFTCDELGRRIDVDWRPIEWGKRAS